MSVPNDYLDVMMLIVSAVFVYCQSVSESSGSDNAVGAAVQYSAVDVSHSDSEVLPEASIVLPQVDV